MGEGEWKEDEEKGRGKVGEVGSYSRQKGSWDNGKYEGEGRMSKGRWENEQGKVGKKERKGKRGE